MGMIIDVLSKKIRDMKDLRQREERRDNKDAQDALDRRFKDLTIQIHSLMVALQYTKENMQFQLSEQVLSDLENLLAEHKGVIRSGYAEKEAIDKTQSDYKHIQQSIKKEWSEKYSILAKSKIETLQAISSIDTESVSRCLDGIHKGSNWTMNIEDFKRMNESLSDAASLIDSLRLDQQIIDFLKKMNNGKAMVSDLNDNVLHWMKEESLDKRVKLSFSGGNKKY